MFWGEAVALVISLSQSNHQSCKQIGMRWLIQGPGPAGELGRKRKEQWNVGRVFPVFTRVSTRRKALLNVALVPRLSAPPLNS